MPTKKFEQKEIDQIVTMSGLGLPVEQMAAILGVSKATFDRRQSDQPEVREAVLKGRAQSSLNVRQTAYSMAVSGEFPALTIFWLKCREQWKEPRDSQESADSSVVLSYDHTRRIEKRVTPIPQTTPANASKNSGVLTDGKKESGSE